MHVTKMSSRLFDHVNISKSSPHSGGRWRQALLLMTAFSRHPHKCTLAFSSSHPMVSTFVPSNHRLLTTKPTYGGYQRLTKRFLSREANGNTSQNHDPSSSEATSTSSIQDPREFILSRNPEPEDQEILQRTMDWVQGVVIGLNLCPFAEKPWRSKQLYMEVIAGTDESEILSRVLGECLVRQNKPGTSLMICPDLYPQKFDAFLQVYNILNEGVLVDNDLTDDIQVAPFHPLFEFEGSGSDGVDNYTNRSPYPIFHILREEDVGRAVDLLDGDASKVWRRNVDLLEGLGEVLSQEQMEKLMTGKVDDSTIREKVKSILRDLKKRPQDI